MYESTITSVQLIVLYFAVKLEWSITQFPYQWPNNWSRLDVARLLTPPSSNQSFADSTKRTQEIAETIWGKWLQYLLKNILTTTTPCLWYEGIDVGVFELSSLNYWHPWIIN